MPISAEWTLKGLDKRGIFGESKEADTEITIRGKA
jgi:hypothetical protein